MIYKIKGKLRSIKKRIFSRLPKGHLDAITDTFYEIVSKNMKIKRVASGFQFTEGPIWMENSQTLLFSDIPSSIIYRMDKKGKVGILRKPSFNSNGLTLDKQGRLIACEHGSRRLTRTEKDGAITILADKFNDKKLNSPNDVIVKSDGSIYFTDPPYGIQANEQEQPIQAVYRISIKTGIMDVVADDFECPNGLAFSPDESKLYIDDSSPSRRHLRVCEVREDGTLGTGQIFCDMNIKTPGSPDGMKLDQAGNIYCTGPGGIWVLDSSGHHLGTVVTPEPPANCAWGDDGQTLYITAQTSVYKIRTTVSGIKV